METPAVKGRTWASRDAHRKRKGGNLFWRKREKMNGRKSFYSSEEFQSFLACHTYKETAERFSLTQSAVESAAKRRRLKFVKEKRKGRERIFDRESLLSYYETHSAEETAVKFGCSKSLLYHATRKHGFSLRKTERRAKKNCSVNGRIPDGSKKNVLFYLRFHTIGEAAERFGLKKCEVAKIYMEAEK